jgi:hypothetical protein
VEPHHSFLRPAKGRAVWICAVWRRWRTRRTLFSPSGSVDTALEIGPRSCPRNMVSDSAGSSIVGARYGDRRCSKRSAHLRAHKVFAVRPFARSVVETSGFLALITAGLHAGIVHPVVGAVRRIVGSQPVFLLMRLRLLGTRIGILGDFFRRRAAAILVGDRAYGRGRTSGEGDPGDRGVHQPATGASFVAEGVRPHETHSDRDEGLSPHTSSVARFCPRRLARGNA